MRVKVNFKSDNEVSVSLDYNYNIYLNLRKVLFDYLKNNKPKYVTKYKNNFPLFTFSQLMIPKRIIEPGFIRILSDYFSLSVSSEDNVFMEYMIKALYSKKFFPIFHNSFEIKKIDIIEEPDFTSPMKFRMLSPMFLAKKEGNKVRFIRPEDEDLNECFLENLIERRSAIYKDDDIIRSVRLEIDQNYFEKKKRITRFFTIRNINYKTILAPIKLEGDIELIKFAYRNGIGSKTSYGFGMIEPL